MLLAYRFLFHVFKMTGFRLDTQKLKRIVIVGRPDEASRVKQLLETTQVQSELAGFIGIDKKDKGKLDPVLNAESARPK